VVKAKWRKSGCVGKECVLTQWGDRLIQQALLQVLQPLSAPTFSEHSHGFRPGRWARDAELAAQQYV